MSPPTGSNIPSERRAPCCMHETVERIELDVLEKPCKYFNCKIEDLIEYIPGDETRQAHTD
ncbi:helix-turn-helix transcriptional regulator [Chitinilyticum litopenaei]|uniref:Helix-turn-helix transcriptional regulator n=1 Tax=Chitinilyticum piscinae TaxID=2866724 RepID=A0A8J7FHB3_9NEIS|nr:helix-turn-helix transcriptional regulator [Chitinilyticum piscinae]